MMQFNSSVKMLNFVHDERQSGNGNIPQNGYIADIL